MTPELTLPEQGRIYHYSMFISQIRKTNPSRLDKYGDIDRKKLNAEFEVYYAEQKKRERLKEEILSSLKGLLPEDSYQVLEEVVKGLKIESGKLEKLVLGSKKLKLPPGKLIAEIMLKRSAQIKAGEHRVEEY